MLLREIKCDKFISYGEKRKPICFHEGLNTILGGVAADNSIGKTTFMLVIDYAFGGSRFATSDAASQIGDHTIFFTFEDGDKTYRFSRSTGQPKVVNVLDTNGLVYDTWKLEEYTDFLLRMYHMDHIEALTFRDSAGRYSRVDGKDNINLGRPIHAKSNEKPEYAILSLEKLFEKYASVVSYKKAEDEAKKKKDTFSRAQNYGYVLSAVKTEKQLKKNEAEIEKTEQELVDLLSQTDIQMTEEEYQSSLELQNIRRRIKILDRQRQSFQAELDLVRVNLDSGGALSEQDLRDLLRFFPDANVKSIAEVEHFHKSIQEILHSELIESSDNLEALLTSVNSEIAGLKARQRELGMPAKVSMAFLDQQSELREKIRVLRAQNEAYHKKLDVKALYDSAVETRQKNEEAILAEISAGINAELVRKNDVVFPQKDHMPPALTFQDGKHYTFGTPNDTGNGTAYKDMILYDLSLLDLSALPIIIHDSSMFKNVGDAPIDKIFDLYMAVKDKQIFIAFDKAIAYPENVQTILDATTVLQLDPGGNELYGRYWGSRQP